jgi:hypothetical protein
MGDPAGVEYDDFLVPHIFNSTNSWLGDGPDGLTEMRAGRETRYPSNMILWSFREAAKTTSTPLPELAALWLATERVRPWNDWGSHYAIQHAKRVLRRLSASALPDRSEP